MNTTSVTFYKNESLDMNIVNMNNRKIDRENENTT